METIPVRAAVAGNPGLPLKAFSELAHSPEEKVHAGLATNPHLSAKLFWHLAADSSLIVQCNLATNLSLPLDLLNRLLLTENLSVWESIARNLQASPEILIWLAQKKHENLYEAIAQNKNASADLLRWLTREYEKPPETFWYALVSHPQTSIDVLQVILSRSNLKPDLFLHIVRHPLLASKRDQILLKHLIRCLQEEMQRGTSRFKLLLLTHPDAPIEVLEVFARSARWEERYLVARHQKTTPDLLKVLQKDPVIRVRANASRRVSDH